MAEIEFSTIKSPLGKSNHLLRLLETFEKAYYCIHVNVTKTSWLHHWGRLPNSESMGRTRMFPILEPVGLAIWLLLPPQVIITIDSSRCSKILIKTCMGVY